MGLLGYFYIRSINNSQEEIEEDETNLPSDVPTYRNRAKSHGGGAMERKVPLDPSNSGGLEMEDFATEYSAKGGGMLSPRPDSNPNLDPRSYQ